MTAGLAGLYETLLAEYGPQGWWPARTPFEMTVGAILTQNTAWSNVEKAIDALRSEAYLNPARMARARTATLARLVRPAGYFNQKAARLREWAKVYAARWRALSRGRIAIGELRGELLSVSGIGPETADSILCYALGRPVFVIDAYTRRVLARMGFVAGDEPYEELRAWCESRLPADPGVLGEFHALLVRHAKEHCRKRPACDGCAAGAGCRHAGALAERGG